MYRSCTIRLWDCDCDGTIFLGDGNRSQNFTQPTVLARQVGFVSANCRFGSPGSEQPQLLLASTRREDENKSFTKLFKSTFVSNIRSRSWTLTQDQNCAGAHPLR